MSAGIAYASIAAAPLQARNRTAERLTLRQLELTDLADRPPGLKIVDVFRPPKTRARMLEGKPDEIARTMMEIIKEVE